MFLKCLLCLQDEGIDSDFQDDQVDDGNESDNPDGILHLLAIEIYNSK